MLTGNINLDKINLRGKKKYIKIYQYAAYYIHSYYIIYCNGHHITYEL